MKSEKFKRRKEKKMKFYIPLKNEKENDNESLRYKKCDVLTFLKAVKNIKKRICFLKLLYDRLHEQQQYTQPYIIVENRYFLEPTKDIEMFLFNHIDTKALDTKALDTKALDTKALDTKAKDINLKALDIFTDEFVKNNNVIQTNRSAMISLYFLYLIKELSLIESCSFITTFIEHLLHDLFCF
jgi:hypothetical protein